MVLYRFGAETINMLTHKIILLPARAAFEQMPSLFYGRWTEDDMIQLRKEAEIQIKK